MKVYPDQSQMDTSTLWKLCQTEHKQDCKGCEGEVQIMFYLNVKEVSLVTFYAKAIIKKMLVCGAPTHHFWDG